MISWLTVNIAPKGARRHERASLGRGPHKQFSGVLEDPIEVTEHRSANVFISAAARLLLFSAVNKHPDERSLGLGWMQPATDLSIV